MENRYSDLSSNPSTSFDNIPIGMSVPGNLNYPPIHIMLSPQFFSNTGTIIGNPQLSTVFKLQEEDINLPAHQ